MAIHISTDYYWIRPPQELKDRAYNLAYIGALANKLKLNDIYNKAKAAHIELCNQWDREGRAMAKKKTDINWLGGGKQYYTESLMSWDVDYGFTKQIADMCSIKECEQDLKQLLSNL